MTGKRILQGWLAAMCSLVVVGAGAVLVGPLAASALSGGHASHDRAHAAAAAKAFAPTPKILRGTFTIEGAATDSDQPFSSAINFGGWSLGSAPKVHVIKPHPAHKLKVCRGSVGNPTAKPGHLCIYERFSQNADDLVVCSAGNNCNPHASPFGVNLVLFSLSSGIYDIDGSWAAAPKHTVSASKLAARSSVRGGVLGR